MKHDWRRLGEGGLYECRECRQTRFANSFGSLWYLRWWRNRCAPRGLGIQLEPATRRRRLQIW